MFMQNCTVLIVRQLADIRQFSLLIFQANSNPAFMSGVEITDEIIPVGTIVQKCFAVPQKSLAN